MKNIRFLSALAVLLLLSSCHLDPPEIPAAELFTRSFIKKFGLIDPNQSWNQAVSAEVTLVSKEPIHSGKVYAKSNSKYYLVADITDFSGSVTIPIEVVSGVQEIKMVLDGETYYTTLGGKVDTSDPKSRNFVPEGSAQSGINANDRVVITDRAEVIDVPTEQVFQLFSILPEGGPVSGSQSFPGNLRRPEIKTDFLLNSGPDGKEITVFPVYWNTCQTHELGIYYFNTSDPSQENAGTVVRVPFYQMHKSPDFENIGYLHRTHDGHYEYTYLGPETAVDPVKAKYNVQAYRDYGVSPSEVAYYNFASNDRSQLEDILKYGSCQDGADADQTFYALRKGVNKGRETRMSGNVGEYMLYSDNTHKFSWKVELKEAHKGTGGPWDNQMRLHLPRLFGPGDSFKLTFSCKLLSGEGIDSHPVDGSLQVEASKATANGTYVGNISLTKTEGSSTYRYDTDWQTYEGTFTVPADLDKGGAWVDVIVFNLNNTYTLDGETETRVANTYVFDDIKLEAFPFDARYSASYWRSEKNYRLLDDASWTRTKKYVGDGLENASGEAQFDVARTVTETVQNPGTYANSHLLMRDNRDPEGVLRLPLADAEAARNSAFEKDANMSVHTTGIKIKIPANRRYGFYLHFYDNRNHDVEKYIYSEVKGNGEFLNITKGWTDYDLDNQTHRDYVTYCAMFDQYVSRSANGSRATEKFTYLTFEDWTPNAKANKHHDPEGDYDLNDLAFMVKGLNIDKEIVTEKEEQFDFLICCEDLGSTDDFDFNDMIVGVKILTHVDGSKVTKTVTFRALAAGGTLPLYLHCQYNKPDGTPVANDLLYPDGAGDMDAEWHRWFGVMDVKTMINTYNKRNQGHIYGRYCTITTNGDFKLEKFGRVGDEDQRGIGGIYVTKGSPEATGDVNNPFDEERGSDSNLIAAPDHGEAPQMFLIEDIGYGGGVWQWPSERSAIQECYPLFMEWANSSGKPAEGTPEESIPAKYYWYKQQPSVSETHGVYTGR